MNRKEWKAMKCIIFGGSGEVGKAVCRASIRSDVCGRLTMLVRREVTSLLGEAKVDQIVVDTGSADFEAVVKEKAAGHDVAISCLGIGSGTFSISEERLMEIEVGLSGKFARGCKAAGIEIFELLTAVDIDETLARSRLKVFRVMGLKHKAVLDAGFEKLAVFKPGMIVGNAHSPRWLTPLTGLIPNYLGFRKHPPERRRPGLRGPPGKRRGPADPARRVLRKQGHEATAPGLIHRPSDNHRKTVHF